jgi:hypothetical protein
MKATLLLALTALLAVSGIQGQTDSLGGKWVADGAVQAGAAQGGLGGAGGGGQIILPGGSYGTRGSFPGSVSGGYRLPRPVPRVAELDLTVDLDKETLSGSIKLPGDGKTECGKLKIESGRTNGRTLAFTTHRSINGSRIPTPWTGEIMGGAVYLRTVGILPCNSIAAASQYAANSSFSSQSSSLAYRRGDMDSRKADVRPMSPEGHWWTTDDGRVTALDLGVARKGRITGSVNLCGDSMSRIENGTVTGRTIRFETYSQTGSFKVRQLWSGSLVDENMLKLSSQIALDCAYPDLLSIVFRRS